MKYIEEREYYPQEETYVRRRHMYVEQEEILETMPEGLHEYLTERGLVESRHGAMSSYRGGGVEIIVEDIRLSSGDVIDTDDTTEALSRVLTYDVDATDPAHYDECRYCSPAEITALEKKLDREGYFLVYDGNESATYSNSKKLVEIENIQAAHRKDRGCFHSIKEDLDQQFPLRKPLVETVTAGDFLRISDNVGDDTLVVIEKEDNEEVWRGTVRAAFSEGATRDFLDQLTLCNWDMRNGVFKVSCVTSPLED